MYSAFKKYKYNNILNCKIKYPKANLLKLNSPAENIFTCNSAALICRK